MAVVLATLIQNEDERVNRVHNVKAFAIEPTANLEDVGLEKWLIAESVSIILCESVRASMMSYLFQRGGFDARALAFAFLQVYAGGNLTSLSRYSCLRLRISTWITRSFGLRLLVSRILNMIADSPRSKIRYEVSAVLAVQLLVPVQ